MSSNRQIFRKTVLVTAIGGIGQVLGFLLTLLIARQFGATEVTDAYYLAVVVPVLLTGLLSGVVKLVFVPVFVEERIQRPETAQDVISAAVFFLLVLGILLAAAAAVPIATGLVSLGGTEETRQLARELMLLMLPVVPLGIMAGLFNSVYNAHQRFGAGEVSRAIVMAVTILCLLAGSSRWGIYSVAVGQVLGHLVGLAIMVPVVHRTTGFSLRPRYVISDPFRRMVSLSLVAFGSYVLSLFTPMLGRVMASFLPEGSVSVLSYAEKLATIPGLVIGSGFTGVLVSFWSKMTAEGEKGELAHSMNRGLSAMWMLLVPMAVGMILLRDPLVTIAYRRGEFGPEAAAATARVFAIIAAGIVPTYLHMTIVRIFLAEKAMNWLVGLSAMAFALTLGLMAWFLWIGAGVEGLAAAVVISTTVVVVVESVIVHRRYVPLSFDHLLKGAAMVVAASVAMGLVVQGLFPALSSWLGGGVLQNRLMAVGGTAAIGAAMYFVMLRVMGHPEVSLLARLAGERWAGLRGSLS